MKKAKYSASEVAKAIIYNYILKQKADFIPENLLEFPTQLKLQKLLYFVQAAFLSLLNYPAFNEEIEAWQHWPVVPEIFYEFKRYKNYPIILNLKDLKKVYKKFTKKEKDLISFINKIFWKYSALKLVEITHKHEPWRKAYEWWYKKISKKTLQSYYKSLFEFEVI